MIDKKANMSFFQQTSSLGGGQSNMPAYLDQNDFEVQHSLTDSVSQMKFAPLNATYAGYGAPLLAVASWDGNVSLAI